MPREKPLVVFQRPREDRLAEPEVAENSLEEVKAPPRRTSHVLEEAGAPAWRYIDSVASLGGWSGEGCTVHARSSRAVKGLTDLPQTNVAEVLSWERISSSWVVENATEHWSRISALSSKKSADCSRYVVVLVPGNEK